MRINPSELVQTNRSDTLGSLWSTWNIDLQDNEGKVRVSPRFRINQQTSDLANLGCPVAFKRFGTSIYTVAGAAIFVNSTMENNNAFVQDASSGGDVDYDPDYSDLETFNLDDNTDVLAATSNDALRTLNNPGGTWTLRDTLSSGSPHKLVFFKKLNRLYYAQNEHLINSMDVDFTPADTGDFTLDWNDGRVDVIDMKASTDFIWIGMNQSNFMGSEGAAIWRWDGIATFKEFIIKGAVGVLAITIDFTRDIPIVMCDNGVLYEFNGGGFVEIGRLPYTKHLPKGIVISSLTANNSFIHPNGLIYSKNGTVLALINNLNGDNAGTIEENLPSGVWEWSREHGFVHKAPLTYDPLSSSITDYGQNRVSRVGALAEINLHSTTAGRDGTMLAGATIYTDATTTTSAIFYDNSLDTIQKYGYLVTTKIFSGEIEDTWQKFYVRHKKLLDSDDHIVVKYRQDETPPVEATITWTSATTFTTTTDVSAYANYEVEVIQGKGSGKCSKIVSVTGSGTYTVTTQETFTGATSGTAKARFQFWKEIGKQTSQIQSYLQTSINNPSTWIQLKICMQFEGEDEIDDFILTSDTHKAAD